jgi:hypothetical protein
MNNNQKKFKRNYIISFLVLILLEIFILLSGYRIRFIDRIAAINLQQALILLVLIGLPGVLFWSNKKVINIKKVESFEIRLKEYSGIVNARLLVFTGLGLFTIIVQLLTELKGLEMLFLVIICFFMFIWPTRSRLEQETGIINGEEDKNSLEPEEIENIDEPFDTEVVEETKGKEDVAKKI